MEEKRINRYRRRLYNQLPLIGGWFRLNAARTLAKDGSAGAVGVLAEAVTRGDDEQVCGVAMAVLRQCAAQPEIDSICGVWANTRHADLAALLIERNWVASRPAEVRVLSALKVGRGAVLLGEGAHVVYPLVTACYDADVDISYPARCHVLELTNPEAVDQLCAWWAQSRHEFLEEVVLRANYVAAQPIELRVLSALKVGQSQITAAGDAEVVAPLVEASRDNDPLVAKRAYQDLCHLEREEAQEALCRLVVHGDDPNARQAALVGQYLPRDPYQRVLYYFMTEQWDSYEALDFDRRMLLTVHQAADPDLRRRITERLRLAGKTDFLIILAGGDYHSRVDQMMPREIEVLVQGLASNQEWAELWRLAFELPFSWSVHIVKLLVQTGWRPEGRDDPRVFERLALLASAGMATGEQEISSLLPVAVQRARAMVPGRINDVAFSPTDPLIAIGTGQRKVALWNFQRGEREELLDGFEHSIGRVAFTRAGVLLCAERTNSTQGICAIHGRRNGTSFRLGQHEGSVTTLAPIAGSQLLTTGRDHKVIVWDTESGSQLEQGRAESWPRSACVSPDGRLAGLLHQGVTLVTLPELEQVTRLNSKLQGSTSQCAAFAPDGSALVVGLFKGYVVVCNITERGFSAERRPFAIHGGPVQGITVLPDRDIIVTAGAEGRVQFTSWSGRAPIGSVMVPGERLTSLRVSPDGAFMAIGDSNSSMSLWDLRVLDVPLLLTRPLVRAAPSSLAAVSALAGDSNLHRTARPALQFIECVLQHRFRYDIEIAEVPTIRVGEFDIEIEG